MELVIFSSILPIGAMAAAVMLYLLTALSRIFLNDDSFLPTIFAILNFIVHLGIFAICVLLKATAQEYLFILTVSSALALTVSRTGKEKEE